MITSARSSLRRSLLAARSAPRRRLAAGAAAVLPRRLLAWSTPLSAAPYSTERLLELRGGRRGAQSLYNARDEKENCGVGLIASLKSEPSRKIVERADEMLVRMAHRGGCGCDPASGDGSGECIGRRVSSRAGRQ